MLLDQAAERFASSIGIRKDTAGFAQQWELLQLIQNEVIRYAADASSPVQM